MDTADMEAMEEATVDTEHAIKTMATSDDTTPSRIKSLELLGLMEMLELLEDRGDGDEEREAMAVDSEEALEEATDISKQHRKRLLPWTSLHPWLLLPLLQFLRSEDSRYKVKAL